MPYLNKKGANTSDVRVTNHFPDFIAHAPGASKTRKAIRSYKSNLENWHLDSLGRPYLVNPKTNRTMHGVRPPSSILFVFGEGT